MPIVSPPLVGDAGISIIGHRGASATHPENTLEAFAAAFAAGAQAVELDVIPTSDNVLAVTHNFVTAEGRDVRASRYADLSGVPRLEQVVALAGGVFDIEMKTRPGLGIGDGDYVGMVVRAIRAAGVWRRCIVRSFDAGLLREMHRVAPTLPLAALTANPLTNWVRYAKRVHAGCISPHCRLVSARRVARAHRAGLYVMPWTANDPLVWERMIQAGVDGIITDNPAALAAYLGARRDGVGRARRLR